MDDLINRANLPSVLNGVTMSECDKVIEPFLEERSCDEVWHTVRALRDFYDWVMNENAVKPCKDDLIKRSDVLETYADLYDIFDDNKEIQKEFDKVFDKLNSIPVVEPSEYADIAYGIGVCQGKASVEPCEDAVSREWLLDELEQMNVANFYEANFHSNEVYEDMKQMIKDAPSVAVEPNLILPEHMERGDIYDVGETITVMNHEDYMDMMCKAMMWDEYGKESKHSKWKINNNGWAYCPECKSLGLESYNFCPYCGTKMFPIQMSER